MDAIRHTPKTALIPRPRPTTDQRVIVDRVEPHRCMICGTTDIRFTITLLDKSLNRAESVYNSVMNFACTDHLEAATAILYRERGWVTDPEPPTAEV